MNVEAEVEATMELESPSAAAGTTESTKQVASIALAPRSQIRQVPYVGVTG